MIASEESEAGEGWDYDAWVDDLYAKKTTPEILKAVVDGFILDNGGTSSSSNDQTLSYLDLSKAEQLINAVDSYARAINVKSSSDFSKVKNAQSSALQFGDKVFGNVDGISLMNKLKTKFTDVSIDEVTAAINDLVAYNKYGNYYKSNKPCGVCLFVAYGNYGGYGLQVSKSDYTTSDTLFVDWRAMNYNYGF